MLNRNVSLALCLSVISGAAFAQSNQGTGYIFEFASPSTASGQFEGFLASGSSLGSPLFNNTGPAGATSLVVKPDGSQFYMAGSTGLVSFNPTFTTPQTINGVTGSLTQTVITPDGRYLLVASNQGGGANTLYVINTTSNSVTLTYPTSGSIVGMAVSRDSQTAWVLTASSQTLIAVVNLATQTVTASVILRDPATDQGLGGDPTSISLSPLGELYVTAENQILQINPPDLLTCIPNPATCIPVATVLQVLATPGPLQFTPDGTLAYFVNQTPSIGGKSLLRVPIPFTAASNALSWPPFVPGEQPEQFDSIAVVSSTRLLAHSPADTTLWDVAPDFSTVAVSALSTVVPVTNVVAMALSNELPAAQTAFLLVGGGQLSTIYRVSLNSNTVTSQGSAAFNTGTLQFVYVPQEANPSLFLQYNTPQTVAAGATAAPLIARVLDAAGRPVFDVPVTFTDPSGTITFSNVSQATNADGYVQATATVGQTPGTYPITLTAGTSGSNVATTTFSLVIPGGVQTGPSGVNQMSIVFGNGELFQAGEPHFDSEPLTVLVVDTNGNPLPGVAVTFTVTGPNIASLDDPSTTTDQNGLAYTDLFPLTPPQFTPYQVTQVTASSSLGAVVFQEVVFQIDPTGTGVPQFTVLQPTGGQTITAGEGDVVPNAIQVGIFTTAFGSAQPIPNVSIRITDAASQTANGPGTCQGNPLSDQTGTVTCNFVAACATSIAANGSPLGLGLHGFDIDLGEYNIKTGYSVNIVPGSHQTLVIGSGNNQSGNPGAALSVPLVAQVTDQCGTAVQGVNVTWKVIQGGATLSNTTTVSNQGGNASTKVTLGQTAGTVQITATAGSASVTFNETVSAVVGNLALVSGGNQTALLNQAFASPVVFQITDSHGNPYPGLTVNFSVVGGSASISPPSATTNSQGQVSVSVTAGATAGTITISATYGSFTATASLTAQAPGLPISASSFANLASSQPGLVPCGLATVTGTGLAASVNGVVIGNPTGIGPLPYTLAGVTITVNLIPAPIRYVLNQNGIQQVNFQTPCETVPGNATVIVQVNSSTTTVNGVTIYPAQPGIFTYAGPSGIAYGEVISATNGSYLTPSNLAVPGNTYYLVATGLGQTTPAITTNAAGTGAQIINPANVVLAIDNIGVPVNSVVYQPEGIGVYLIQFTIPTLANNAPFPTGQNLPITLGVIAGGQTIFDTAPAAIPGIQ